MGNRAVVVFVEKGEEIPINDKFAFKEWLDRQTGVYLHWNGGADSVVPFLEYCRLLGVRSEDTDYAAARFCQVVGNYFGDSTLSVGVAACRSLDTDNWDNGTYIVKEWKVALNVSGHSKERVGYHQLPFTVRGPEIYPPPPDMDERLYEIHDSQPIAAQRLYDLNSGRVRCGEGTYDLLPPDSCTELLAKVE